MSKEVVAVAAEANEAENVNGRRAQTKVLSGTLLRTIFHLLEGEHLARAREVCRKWNEVASEEDLWKALCVKKWNGLEGILTNDEHLWHTLSRNRTCDSPRLWRHIYPNVYNNPLGICRLQKLGLFLCNVIAHQIAGYAASNNSVLPDVLVVERRFNILHLQTFVLPDAAVLYFEPEQESDRAGFNDFIEYLAQRKRAGLALEEQRRFIFIPPCEYTRTQIEYNGQGLLGVIQNAYPPLAP